MPASDQAAPPPRSREPVSGIPDLSIVVPTIPRRAHYLERCLAALAAGDVRERLEVLVVTEEPERVAALVAQWAQPIAVRVVVGPGPAARKRNAGIRAARAPFIAFLDDDTQPEAGWARALLAAFENGARALAGRVDPDFEAPLPEYLAGSIQVVRGFNALRGWRREGFVIGCNIAFARTVFEHIGLFSPDFGRRGTCYSTGDETEFVARVRLRYPVRYCEEAGVRHAIQARRLERSYLYARTLRAGRANAGIDRRHHAAFARNVWSVALLLPIASVRALARPRSVARRLRVLHALSYVVEALRLALAPRAGPAEIPRLTDPA